MAIDKRSQVVHHGIPPRTGHFMEAIDDQHPAGLVSQLSEFLLLFLFSQLKLTGQLRVDRVVFHVEMDTTHFFTFSVFS